MGRIKAAWNLDRTASVVLAKIKEFTITESSTQIAWIVKGWYNKENCFTFGEFLYKKDAENFLEDIHRNM